MPGPVNPKDPAHGLLPEAKRILVSLDELTSVRGENMTQNLYIMVFGFKDDPTKPYQIPSGSQQNHVLLDLLKKETRNYFFAWLSPVYTIRRERPFTLSVGLPLYEGYPKLKTSLYLGIFEGDWSTLPGFKQTTQSSQSPADHRVDAKQFFGFPGNSTPPDQQKVQNKEKTIQQSLNISSAISDLTNQFEQILSTQEQQLRINPALDRPAITQIKDLISIALYGEPKESELDDPKSKIFQYLIKAWEMYMIANSQSIRYTNVFTFRDNEYWLNGNHRSWGDQRVELNINVEVETLGQI